MKKKCMAKGCKKTAILRGCCHCHYFKAYRAIKAGAIRNWKQAGQEGLALAEKGTPGPKRT